MNLKQNLEQFLHTEIALLGHRISKDGIKVSQDKIKSIVDAKTPKNVKQVRPFLGLSGYYRKFCQDYAKVAAPLTNLTKHDNPFKWGEEEQATFEKLKELLISTPVLRYFDENLHTTLSVDASIYGVGSILEQTDEHGVTRPVAYASRKLESRYPNIESECLAISWAIGHFRHYWYMKKFTVYTDCEALTHLNSVKDPSSRLKRFALKLQEYDMVIKYRPGKKNVGPDFLSRNPVGEAPKGEVDDSLEIYNIQVLDLPKLQREDDELSKIFRSIEHPSSVSSHDARMSRRFVIRNDILYKEGFDRSSDLIMVPKSLRLKLIEARHSNPIGGAHQGVRKCVDGLANNYYWPNMEASVRDLIQRCQHCQYRKTLKVKEKAGLLKPIAITENIFEKWTIDVCQMTKSDRGNMYVVAACEYLSGYLVTKAVKTTTAEDICDFMTELIMRFGIPTSLTSDNGKNFLSKAFQLFLKQMGCHKINISSYHPQSNGMCESNFKSLADSLSLYINNKQSDWDKFLEYVTFTLNSSPKETRGGVSPFFILYGVDAKLPIDVDLLPKGDVEDIDTRVARIRTVRENVARYYNQGKEKQEQYYNQKRKTVKFEVGDLVMLYSPRNYKSLCSMYRKLLCRWNGPFKVTEVFNNYLNYRIKDLRSGKLETVHIS